MTQISVLWNSLILLTEELWDIGRRVLANCSLKKTEENKKCLCLQFLVLNIAPLCVVLKKPLFPKRKWLRKSAGEPEARAPDISGPELYSWGGSFCSLLFLSRSAWFA